MEENLQDSLFLDLEILAVVLIGKTLLEVMVIKEEQIEGL